jgi:hypothetical protein
MNPHPVDEGQLGTVVVITPTHEVCDLVEQLGHGELWSVDPEGMEKAGADAGPACKADEPDKNV